MTAKTNKNASITITESDEGERKALCVNRFKIQREGSFNVITLAFALGGFTLNTYVVVVPATAVDATKKSVLDYLDRLRPNIGNAESEKPSDINQSQQAPVFYGNHVGFAHVGQLAQIRVMSFDLRALGVAGTKNVMADRVATFEMPVETQLGILTALYVSP